MSAPIKNQYWKLRKSSGRKFKSPAALLKACMDYFEWGQDHPLYAAELVKFEESSEIVPVPKMRAMTIEGLCTHLGIGRTTWRRYRKYEHEFSEICSRVETMIRAQKIEGAAAGLFNPAIIIRELSMPEKQKIDSKGRIAVRYPVNG